MLCNLHRQMTDMIIPIQTLVPELAYSLFLPSLEDNTLKLVRGDRISLRDPMGPVSPTREESSLQLGRCPLVRATMNSFHSIESFCWETTDVGKFSFSVARETYCVHFCLFYELGKLCDKWLQCQYIIIFTHPGQCWSKRMLQLPSLPSCRGVCEWLSATYAPCLPACRNILYKFFPRWLHLKYTEMGKFSEAELSESSPGSTLDKYFLCLLSLSKCKPFIE